jgi:organic radical activating enzyme
MVVAMLVAIGVMSKKVGMQNCILQQVIVIVQNASKYAETVVVTGGEPLMWDMSLLTKNLKNVGQVHIETSGAYPLSGTWDWICLSPKRKNKLPTDRLQCSHG